jgi:hypothetical protein
MIDFPNSPTLNQTFTSGGKTWRWSGTAWTAHSTGSSAPRFWAYAEDAAALYLGSILLSDIPATGSVYDSALWDIVKTTTNSSGEVLAEASATGAWSNKQNLTYL